MLQDRTTLESQLDDIFAVISIRKNLLTSIQEKMQEKHDMTISETNHWILGMNPLSQASDEEIFWFAQTVLSVLASTDYSELTTEIILSKLFTKQEQREYSYSKVKRQKSTIYPIVFDNVIQVNDDQWVTVIDVNQLWELSQHQVINYNRLTQRPPKDKYVAGFAAYSIMLKRKSVQEIAQQLQTNMFISNDLTLNLNLDNPEVEFTYDLGQIVVTAGQLDIIDGYHRYRSAMETKDNHPDFNYHFILNIMNFDESKACRYIAQQDKRNKINTNVSKSMDSSDPINLVIKRFNEDTGCYLCGKVGRLGAETVNSVFLFTALKHYYPRLESKDAFALEKKLKTLTNSLSELDETILSHTFSFKEVVLLVHLLTIFNDDEQLSLMSQCFKKLDTLNSTHLNRGQLTKTSSNELAEWLRKEGIN